MRLIAANPKRKADVANVLSDEVVQTPGLLFLRACAPGQLRGFCLDGIVRHRAFALQFRVPG